MQALVYLFEVSVCMKLLNFSANAHGRVGIEKTIIAFNLKSFTASAANKFCTPSRQSSLFTVALASNVVIFHYSNSMQGIFCKGWIAAWFFGSVW